MDKHSWRDALPLAIIIVLSFISYQVISLKAEVARNTQNIEELKFDVTRSMANVDQSLADIYRALDAIEQAKEVTGR